MEPVSRRRFIAGVVAAPLLMAMTPVPPDSEHLVGDWRVQWHRGKASWVKGFWLARLRDGRRLDLVTPSERNYIRAVFENRRGSDLEFQRVKRKAYGDVVAHISHV